MTREEHIENLKAIASDMPSDKCADWIESLMAGVKALEQDPCEDCCNGNQIEKAKLCQKSYLAGMEHKQEPCDDCVSRRAVHEILNDAYFLKLDDGAALQESVKQLPSVTPQPKMGKWIEHFDESGKWYECDQCHTDWGGSVNYCPNCGSKM